MSSSEPGTGTDHEPGTAAVSGQQTGQAPRAGRRAVLCGAALAALGLTAAACGGSEGSGQDGGSPGPDEPVELGAADAVPVGGAKIYPKQRVLVSRPADGDFKCFSAVCTHQGGMLDSVEKGEAVCPLHGSRFEAATGKVAQGPATKPLPEVPVKVRNGKLVAGGGPLKG